MHAVNYLVTSSSLSPLLLCNNISLLACLCLTRVCLFALIFYVFKFTCLVCLYDGVSSTLEKRVIDSNN